MKDQPLRSSVIGSYPFPGWLESATQRLAEFGSADIAEMQDDAVIVALHDQVAAGLDVVTDGEQTRFDFNLSFYGHLEGLELEGASPRRFGPPAHDQRGKHKVIGELCAPRGLGAVEEFQRLQRLAPPGPTLKASVPGPYTLSGRLVPNHRYPDRWALTEALLSIVRTELAALVEAGCQEISVDEPSMSCYAFREDTRRFVDIFNRTVESVKGRTRLCTHLCFGNYKGRAVGLRRIAPMFPAFLDFHADEMHVEMASREFAELEMIAPIASRMDVAVGIIDVKSYYIETPADVAERVRRCLQHARADRLVFAPDCGLSQTARWAANRSSRTWSPACVACAQSCEVGPFWRAMSDDYGLAKQSALGEIAAPPLEYRPRDPVAYRPAIGLIGCGGIAGHHLAAYQKAGYQVVALCGREASKPEALRVKYFPAAQIYTDFREVLRRPEIEVVDITTHPEERVEIITAALEAGKHVLSQKPFVVDLQTGTRLVALASARGVKLAVNQNGRWAPHFRYLLQAVRKGLVGDLASVSFSLNWDHRWIGGTAFEEVRHLILGDFGIHWFDLVSALFAGRHVKHVFASASRAPQQKLKPPMMAQAVVEFDDGQATLAFNGLSYLGQSDHTVVVGTEGTIWSRGPSLTEQEVTLFTPAGFARPQLEGTWFTSGFHGAMAELLCAIEEGREPENSARENLHTLALCFAARESADSGRAVAPAEIRLS